MDNVLVTGASSRNGRAALAALRDLPDTHVLAGTRRPHPRADGVVEVHLDWEVPDSFGPALTGISAVYLILPESLPTAGEAAHQFLAAAAEAGVGRVVALSARGVEEYPGHPLAAVEEAVRRRAPEWAILKPNWFMQNFTDGVFGPNLARGLIAAPGGSARISFVDVADIGACAARTLVAPAGSPSGAYDLSGPEALTFGQAADVLARTWGVPVRYEEVAIDDPELPQKMGLPPMPDTAPVQALFGRVVAGGEASDSRDIAELLGREPTSLEGFARRTPAPAVAGSAAR
jgi:uncharacterized protein YbjT (DUF2867 family)